MKLAKKDRPYRVVVYDPTWPAWFEKERAVLAAIFGDVAERIEHVGSTSVPGMWAKPQIDILIIVSDLHKVDALIAKMTEAGYDFEVEFHPESERYFIRDAPNGERLVSVHVRAADDPQSLEQVHLRDYLRSHPDDRDRYSAAKRQSYNEGKTNRADYPAGKRAVLTDIIERAKQWRATSREQ